MLSRRLLIGVQQICMPILSNRRQSCQQHILLNNSRKMMSSRLSQASRRSHKGVILSKRTNRLQHMHSILTRSSNMYMCVNVKMLYKYRPFEIAISYRAKDIIITYKFQPFRIIITFCPQMQLSFFCGGVYSYLVEQPNSAFLAFGSRCIQWTVTTVN